jgi:hypothetical protein
MLRLVCSTQLQQWTKKQPIILLTSYIVRTVSCNDAGLHVLCNPYIIRYTTSDSVSGLTNEWIIIRIRQYVSNEDEDLRVCNTVLLSWEYFLWPLSISWIERIDVYDISEVCLLWVLMYSPICGSYSLRAIVAWVLICLVGITKPDRGKRFLCSSKLPGRFRGLPTSSMGAVGSILGGQAAWGWNWPLTSMLCRE